jgi:predicted double-glycine peptidase
MSQTARIRAIIARHRAQGQGALTLATAVRNRLGNRATAAEIDEAVAFYREILDAVPILLDRLREAARE